MSRWIEPIAITRAVSGPPIKLHTGWPSSLPFKSHSAMSTALSAKAALPCGPYHQVRSAMSCQRASTASALFPSIKGP